MVLLKTDHIRLSAFPVGQLGEAMFNLKVHLHSILFNSSAHIQTDIFHPSGK